MRMIFQGTRQAGQMTAARAAPLFTDAEAAGATGADDLANLGPKNANRSLKRKLLTQPTSLAQALLVQNSLLKSQEAAPRNGGHALLAPPSTGDKAF